MVFPILRFAAIAAVLACAPILGRAAHDPDDHNKDKLKRYGDDGTLEERKARVATLKQFRMSEGSLNRALYKIRRASLEAAG